MPTRHAAIVAAMLGACTSAPAPVATPSAPTWHTDVAPLVAEHCTECHRPDGIAAAVDLTRYDNAHAWREVIADAVDSGTMPPFLAAETDACDVPWGFMHDRRLTPTDIDTVIAWVDAGAPEGDPANAVPVRPRPALHIERIDQRLGPTTVFTTAPSSVLEDEFACVVLDPGLDDGGWLEAVEVDVDNPLVLHHVFLYRMSRGDAAALDASDGPLDGRYTCTAAPGAQIATLIAGWAPGAVPLIYPGGSGLAFRPSDVIVAELHYHNVDTPQQDATGIALQWAPSEPDRLVHMEWTGNAADASEGLLPGPHDRRRPEFRIPAGVSGHTETSRHAANLPADTAYQVFMVTPHMHFVGVSLRAWVERADGSEGPCLVHTPRWDFDWQLFYFYDAATGNSPDLRPGDALMIECTYDNTLDNAGVVKVLEEAGLERPQQVSLGQGSLDEMCAVIMGGIPI